MIAFGPFVVEKDNTLDSLNFHFYTDTFPADCTELIELVILDHITTFRSLSMTIPGTMHKVS